MSSNGYFIKGSHTTKHCLSLVLLMFHACIMHAEETSSGKVPEDKLAQQLKAAPRGSINFQISAPHRSQTYSCNLISYSNQCREYEILATADETLAELTDGCQSMGGEFRKTECPDENFVASCVDIVRNYHRPDVIYNNLYYTGAPANWSDKDVERVCADLGGEIE